MDPMDDDQVLTTAATAMLYIQAHFDEWRQWCNELGYVSGPQSAVHIGMQMGVLAELLDAAMVGSDAG